MAAPFFFSATRGEVIMDLCVTHIAGREALGGSRLALVGRHRRTLWMCDGKLRLQKGRPMMVAEKLFYANYQEFEKYAQAKIIRVQVGGPSGKDFLFVKEDALETKQEPAPEPEAVVEEAPAEPEAAPEPEPEPEPEPAKPVEKMTKAELVDFLEGKGFSRDELSQATKKELLEVVLQSEAD